MRDIRFDILKGVAILGVILAHVPLHPVVFQLRNFDVPLFVICSGALFGISSAGDRPWLGYVGSRAYRLLLPCWIFLTIYFLSRAMIDRAGGVPFRFSAGQMIAEYALRSRVIGLWIIRVFLFVSMLAPLLAGLRRRFRESAVFLSILGGCYLLYEIANALAAAIAPGLVYRILTVTLFEAVPYGILFGFGMVLPSLSRRHVAQAALGFGVLHLATALVLSRAGQVIQTQSYKHPPTVYYLSYAVAVSLLLYLAVFHLNSIDLRWAAPFIFLGSSILWVYLWHWFAGDYLVPLTQQSGLLGAVLLKPPVLFLFVLTMTMLVVRLQHIVLEFGIERLPCWAKHQRLLRTLVL